VVVLFSFQLLAQISDNTKRTGTRRQPLVTSVKSGNRGEDMPFTHLSPIPGHPIAADFDCSSLNFPAKFAVVGDFDGDGSMEIAVAPVAPGSSGNDFWVVKFNSTIGAWAHISPIPGHPMGADLDSSGLNFPAKFAVAGDYDGDGHDELAIFPDAAGSAGNDAWVVKFDPAAGAWAHLSPIPGHPIGADLDCSGLNFPAKFAVAGDYDGDGHDELAIFPDAAGSAGNDAWVVKFNPGAGAWAHLSPIPGHPIGADLDCSGLNFPAKFAVAGDYDGDNHDELAVAPVAAGSAGNDFWVVKFNPVAGAWAHLSPIPGHPMGADLDCSGLSFPAKFAVAGDYDGDNHDELAVFPDVANSAGNDAWVVKFNPGAGAWAHLSPIPGHPIGADLDCSGLSLPAKFALVGDFDGDTYDELAVFPDSANSVGNDAWVVKFNPAAGAWAHLSPIPGHPIGADLDCSGLSFPAMSGVAGDYDGDTRAEIAVVPAVSGSAGNDFWVMKYDVQSPELSVVFTGAATLTTADTRFPGPFTSPLTVTMTFSRNRASVKLGPFPTIVVGPFATPLGMNTITITQEPQPAGGGSGLFVPSSGAMTMPIGLHFHHSISLAGDSDVAFSLTTGNSISPSGRFNLTGTPRNPADGMIILVAGAVFMGGFLGGTECSLTIAGTLAPVP
jgi:hypothetical protein